MEGPTTIPQAFLQTAAQRPDDVAYRTRDDEVSITWGEARNRVADLAARLAALGLRRGDTVALMLANRPEFHICDLAVLMTGATPFSVYQTSPPNQIEFIVGDAGRAPRDHRAGLPPADPGGAQRAAGARDRDRRRRRGALTGVVHIGDLAAGDPGFDLEPPRPASSPRTC